ncbi:unnamed protein product, partial [Musa banksii]
RSLIFESNRSKYGPFSLDQGVCFSFPISGHKVAGFHGNAGWYLDSVGFYLKQVRSPSLSKALVPFQSLAASMEGTASQGYDIVLVVRGRGQNFTVLSNTNTRELAWPSQDYRALDLKNKMISFLSYATSEKDPQPQEVPGVEAVEQYLMMVCTQVFDKSI